jgi:hypothetical protein
MEKLYRNKSVKSSVNSLESQQPPPIVPKYPPTSTRANYAHSTGSLRDIGPLPEASLGNTVKLRSKPCSCGFASVQGYEKYALQAASRQVFPDEGVSKCLRIPIGQIVEIHKTEGAKRYHYRNLQTCKSVWLCPCCSGKISEKRRVEVLKAMKGHKRNGGKMYLLTLTLPHRVNQSLKTVLTGLKGAFRSFKQDRLYREGFKVESGFVGDIYSLEATYGENGWHPHLHILLFLDKKIDMKAAEAKLLEVWQKVVVSKGFNEPNEHGLRLEGGEKAANYISKWGLEHEMTKSHDKEACKGYAPFDLLRVICGIYEGRDGMTPAKAEELFREYGKTMKRKHQLEWSRGLKALFGINEKTDEEIIEDVDAETTRFAEIPLPTWGIILSAGRRAEVLAVCHKGKDAFYDYMIELTEAAEGGGTS